MLLLPKLRLSCYYFLTTNLRNSQLSLHRVRLIWHSQLLSCRASFPLSNRVEIFSIAAELRPQPSGPLLRCESPLRRTLRPHHRIRHKERLPFTRDSRRFVLSPRIYPSAVHSPAGSGDFFSESCVCHPLKFQPFQSTSQTLIAA